jgi:hypothetical protein
MDCGDAHILLSCAWLKPEQMHSGKARFRAVLTM